MRLRYQSIDRILNKFLKKSVQKIWTPNRKIVKLIFKQFQVRLRQVDRQDSFAEYLYPSSRLVIQYIYLGQINFKFLDSLSVPKVSYSLSTHFDILFLHLEVYKYWHYFDSALQMSNVRLEQDVILWISFLLE